MRYLLLAALLAGCSRYGCLQLSGVQFGADPTPAPMPPKYAHAVHIAVPPKQRLPFTEVMRRFAAYCAEIPPWHGYKYGLDNVTLIVKSDDDDPPHFGCIAGVVLDTPWHVVNVTITPEMLVP